MSNQLENLNLPVMDGNGSGSQATTVAGSPDGLTITQKPFKTAIAEQPVTKERMPFLPPPDSILQNPGTARATLAASCEKPNGTIDNGYAGTHQNQTVLSLAIWTRFRLTRKIGHSAARQVLGYGS